MVFGELKFTAIRNLGDLGPPESESVVYVWPLTNTLAALLPWIFLLAGLILPVNRNWRAWAVLIPAVGLTILVALTSQVRIPRAGGIEEWFVGFGFLAVGLAALWLFSGELLPRRKAAVVLIALGLLIVVIFSGLYFSEGLESGGFFLLYYLLDAALAPTVVFALLLSRRCCRKRYSPVRFAAWTALWLLVLNAAFACFFVGITFLSFDALVSPWLSFLTQAALYAGIGTVGCVAVLLPYLLLTFHNRLYRARFQTIFSLPPDAQLPVGG